jgi:hypothetical protein
MSKRDKGRHANLKRRKPDFMAGLGGGAVLIGTAVMLVSSSSVDIAQAAALHSDQTSAFKTAASSLAGKASPQGTQWPGMCGPLGPQSGSGGNWSCMGSQGSQGAQGAQGSLGSTVVVTTTASVGTTGSKTVSVSCPSGSTATGGGYSFTSKVNDPTRILYTDRPTGGSSSTPPTGWQISFEDNGANKNQTVTVYAVCSG